MIKTSILILVISVLIFLFIEHINKRSHQLLVDIEHRGNDLIDKTEKRLREIVNDLLLKLNKQTTEQFDSAIEKGRKHIPLQNPYGATTCTTWFGCHNGYCWAGCAGAFPSVTGPEWCYTTKSSGKITCSKDNDCDGCWRCSSPCSV
jgi:hypothetical protein